MRKKILITRIVIILFSLTFISAMYSGESKTFDFGFEIVNCSIINNSSNLDGLNLSWHDTNVTILTVPNYKPDNFTISCWVIKYNSVVEDVVIYSSGGGGGGGSSVNYWDCEEWGECIEGISTRICSRKTNPSITKKDTKTCLSELTTLDYQASNQNEPEKTQEETTTGFLTGAVIGFVKSGKGIGLIFALLIIICGIIAIIISKNKTK